MQSIDHKRFYVECDNMGHLETLDYNHVVNVYNKKVETRENLSVFIIYKKRDGKLNEG